MKLVEMTCKNCGSKLLKKDDKTMVCPNCGSVFQIDEEKNDQIINIYHHATQQPFTANYVNRQLTTSQHSGAVSTVLTVIGIVGILFMFFLILVGCIAFRNAVTARKHNIEMEGEAKSYDKNNTCSELFADFIEEVFGKDSSLLTEQEFERLTYYKEYYQNDCYHIDYRLENGEMKTYDYSERKMVDYTDLNRFPNLETVDISGTFDKGCLDNLPNLKNIGCGNQVSELAEFIPHPENLDSLTLHEGGTLEGIEQFPNLTRLAVDSIDIWNIDGLSALKGLKVLLIPNGSHIMSFEVLETQENMEQLEISADSMKNISFVKNMKKLQNLSLEQTKMIKIDALENLPLKSLSLKGNYEIEDWKVISTLNELKKLEIELNTNQKVPDLKALHKLEKLYVRSAEDISFLQDIPQITELSLYGCDCSNYQFISALSNLNTLKIISMYGNIPDLKFLIQLSNLKNLDISGVSINGSIEEIFAIPEIESININDCNLGLDFTNIKENDTLSSLSMSHVKLMTNIKVSYEAGFSYLDYDEVNLEENIHFLAKFPKLQRLEIAGDKMTRLDFINTMPELKYLDISDNYITDLRPLATLKKLKTVVCKNNEISQGKELGESVTMIYD